MRIKTLNERRVIMRFKTIFILAMTLILPISFAMAHSANPSAANARALNKKISKQVITLKNYLYKLYGPKGTEEKVFVGSEFCLACHQDKVGWKDTKHSMSLRKPMEQYSLVEGWGVIADYDQNGVDDFRQGLNFNEISSGFDPFKPNAPILSVKNGQYTITIGEVDYPVVFISGGLGQWRERYTVRIPAADSPTGYSKDVYFAPIQYNVRTHQWIPYKTKLWYTEDHQPKFTNGMNLSDIALKAKATFSKNCIGCHTTGIRSLGKWDDGEWRYTPYVAVLYSEDDSHYFDYDGDGIKDLVNVGCEDCHGPGSLHILGGGDPTKIINPAKLNVDDANAVCGHCHNRQRSVPNHTFNWPYHDDTDTQWYPGNGFPLSDFYANANEFWPDGETSYEHNQHYAEFYRSNKPTNPYEPMRCFDCHDPHNRTNKHQIRKSLTIDGTVINTKNENDTLCLACHAGYDDFASLTKDMIADYEDNINIIGPVVSAHTHHPYAPDRIMGLSRCSLCHMPSVANAQRASAHVAHTFKVVPPEKTLKYVEEGGMPNACAVSCHSKKVNLWGFGLDPDMLIWNEDFDILTATKLMDYYGPDGIWWQIELESTHKNTTTK